LDQHISRFDTDADDPGQQPKVPRRRPTARAVRSSGTRLGNPDLAGDLGGILEPCSCAIAALPTSSNLHAEGIKAIARLLGVDPREQAELVGEHHRPHDTGKLSYVKR
jgi:hypothetical protein